MFRSAMMAVALVSVAAQASAMELTSAQMKEGAMIAMPQVNSRCGGGNVSPQLSWSGAPANTKGFALTVFDPDANKGKGFWHWAVYDIPASTNSFALGKTPDNVQTAQNSFGDNNYDGPCPPPGSIHHYIFSLWALDTDSILPSEPDAQSVLPELQKHVLARAMLTPRYGR
ncbi:MAG TPA: YbhB/YbcL family Raf kinase inhibitor-like protein [Rhizomicrobium sp.]